MNVTRPSLDRVELSSDSSDMTPEESLPRQPPYSSLADSSTFFFDWVTEMCELQEKPLLEFCDYIHDNPSKWYYREDILQFAIQVTCRVGIFFDLCNMIGFNEAGTYGFPKENIQLLVDKILCQKSFTHEVLTAIVLLLLTTGDSDVTKDFLSSFSVDLQRESMRRALSLLGKCDRADNRDLLVQFEQLSSIVSEKRLASPRFFLAARKINRIALLMIDRGVPRFSSPFFRESLDVDKALAVLKQHYQPDNQLRRDQFHELFCLVEKKQCFSAKQPHRLLRFIHILKPEMRHQGVSEALHSLGRNKREEIIKQFEMFERLYALADEQQLAFFVKSYPEKAHIFLASYLVKAVKESTMRHFPFLDCPEVQSQRVISSAILQLECEQEESPFPQDSFQKLLDLVEQNEELPEY